MLGFAPKQDKGGEEMRLEKLARSGSELKLGHEDPGFTALFYFFYLYKMLYGRMFYSKCPG